MNPPPADSAWSTAARPVLDKEQEDQPRAFQRLWLGFMTARVMLGLLLLLLQGSFSFLSPSQNRTALLVCAAYFGAALAVRLMTRPQQLGNTFDAQWVRTVGVDVVAFATLQLLQSSAINYAPLFAMPVLMVSILGSMMLAMGAAAAVTLLLFSYAAWQSILSPWDANTHFLQAALTGAGCFAISFIASQFASRLASVELRAKHSQLAAAVQRQVNALVIESLTDGIVVVDEQSLVRSANPAAHLLLGPQNHTPLIELSLATQPEWQDLWNVIDASFVTQRSQQSDINLRHKGEGLRRLLVRTQLTEPLNNETLRLCVVFIQDQREMQARIRTEKLASMGRMSAAVAHEIRNPLAAITQANALLTENLTDPAQQRLANMVQQNAQRLEKIVRSVLNLTHAPSPDSAQSGQLLNLTEASNRFSRDWKNQHAITHELLLDLPANPTEVWFDPDHLQRTLINLLDNAQRYTSHKPDCIQVSVDFSRAGAPHFEATLHVWSDGEPLEPSVEQHLFEPFFSSESRSSGLGLYICRELCENHGASMSYGRSAQVRQGEFVHGNVFGVSFKTLSMNFSSQTAPQSN